MMDLDEKLKADEKVFKARQTAIRAILRNFAKLTKPDREYVIRLLEEEKGQ